MLIGLLLGMACGKAESEKAAWDKSAVEDSSRGPDGPKRSVSPQPAAELSAEFLKRASQALAYYLRPEAELLEIRTTGEIFSVQMRKADKGNDLVQVDYVERRKGPAGKSGTVFGPTVISVDGAGELDKNLFPYADINLQKMARAFKVAKLAVDPEDGQIDKMIVRRFLPFSDRVRARIYVRSPRMPGSIDTNEQGTPLKR